MRIATLVLLFLLAAGGRSGAAPFACDTPLADVGARFLPGKTAAQAAEPGALPPCFHVARLDGAEALVLHSLSGDAAVAWKTGRRWTLRPAAGTEQWPPPTGGSIAFVDGRADVFLRIEGAGSGRFGYLAHGREDERHKQIRFTPVTETTGKSEFEFLRHDLVLHTHSGGGDLPMAWTGNAWLPANGQTLLRWSGQQFDVVGRRTFPEPHLTANSFLGALQAGDMARAALYTAAPPVAEKARRLLGDPRLYWSDGEDTAPGSLKWQIRRAEMHNWDLLPPDRRMTPPAAYTFPLSLGRERVLLKMARTPRGWVITDAVKKKAPGRLTAPGAFSWA